MASLRARSQLKSIKVKNVIKSYLLPAFVNTYQTAAVRVLIEKESQEIWLKRRILENLLNEDEHVVGFLSCLTAMEIPIPEKEDDDGGKGSMKSKNKELFAGIAFFVIFDWPNYGIDGYEDHLTKIFLESGVEMVTCKCIRGRGTKSVTELQLASIYLVLKDHDNENVRQFCNLSQARVIRNSAEEEGFSIDGVTVRDGTLYSTTKNSTLWITNRMAENIARVLVNSVEKVNEFMKLHLVNKGSTESIKIKTSKPQSKLLQSVDVVKRYMYQFGYGLHDGAIYKKVEKAKFTYVFCSNVLDFLHFMMGNLEIADQIATNINALNELLSYPSCRLIQQVMIDYNYIEVSDGYCFNIENKSFEKNPPGLRGSPRAFVVYKYDGNVTRPKYFADSVENSIPISRRKLFYQKWYQLLLHQRYPVKEKKLCVIGPANSGKTSWFCPFEGIIPSRYIAPILNDGKFSASLVNENTQAITMDEWTSTSLPCEDAKRILQGGSFPVSMKHRPGVKIQYRSGIFISTNIFPDFGCEADNEAIRCRLEIFKTKPLKEKDCNATKWLRRYCMKVFHYVANELKDTPLWEGGPQEEFDNTGAIYNDFDNDNRTLLSNERENEFSFIDTSNLKIDSTNVRHLTEEGLDRAVIEAGETEGMGYEDTVFQNMNWDIESPQADDQYLEKVYRIATFEDEDSIALSDMAVKIYRARFRTGWNKADSVYDAWLLCQGLHRQFFPYNTFIKLFPDYEMKREVLEKRFKEMLDNETDSNDDEEQIRLPNRKKRKIDIFDDNEEGSISDFYFICNDIVNSMIDIILKKEKELI